MSSGRPKSNEYPMSEEVESHRTQLWMEAYEDSDEESSRRQQRSITVLAKELTQDQLERLQSKLRAKKSSILNSVLDIIPNNLKLRARCICDKLMNTDRVWLNDKHELILDGDALPGSSICSYITKLVMNFSSSGESIQSALSDISTKSTKLRNLPRITRSKPDKSRKRKMHSVLSNLNLYMTMMMKMMTKMMIIAKKKKMITKKMMKRRRITLKRMTTRRILMMRIAARMKIIDILRRELNLKPCFEYFICENTKIIKAIKCVYFSHNTIFRIFLEQNTRF